MTANRATERLPGARPSQAALDPALVREHAAPAAGAEIPRSPRTLTALRFTLAALFVAAGAATLGGAAEVVAPFGTIANVTGLGDWLRVTTGLLEVLGGLLLGARRTAGVGAVLLGVVMTGAAVAHLVVLGTAPTGPAVLLAGLAAVAYAHRAALRVVAAFLVRNL